MDQKIAIISLSTDSCSSIKAIYKDSVLYMSNPTPVARNLSKQRETLVPAVAKLRELGFKVLVDEVTGTISANTGANHVSLKTRHSDGRAAVLVGIERYNEMRRQKTITLPDKNPGAYDIPDSIVDIDYNAQGEAVYHINWADLRPEHILTILCCFATVYHPVTSADYIAAMTQVEDTNKPNIFARTFQALINHQEVTSAEAMPTTMAGKSISDNEVVL